MYKIAVIGSGYVGLVAGACFSDSGNQVTCLDINKSKIDDLNKGKIPIFEPGLEKLIKKNVQEKRLTFSTEIESAVKSAEICFIAVGTPPDEDGSADLQYVLSAAKTVGSVIDNYTIVVDKSTVPVGTAEKVSETIQAELNKRKSSASFSVVSNPEFLREGAALDDFMQPDRVIIGTSDEKAAKVMQKLYKPFMQNNSPIMIMDEKSAELTKYAANSMLALRISFMNEIANVCEKVGADVDNVRRGIGSDFRIGRHFLNSGIGYGGSCFPKDVKAIIKTATTLGYEFKTLKAAEEVNSFQKEKLFNEIMDYYKGNISGKIFAIWGLAFKPNTDDMREAPSIILIEKLTHNGALIQAYDPEAMDEAKRIFGEKIELKEHYSECLDGANALILATEWNDFSNPNYPMLSKKLIDKIVFDGRNIFDPEMVKENKLNYVSIGRKKI